MKILIVSNLFPPHFIGGYEIAAQDTLNILIENNHDCLVLTSEYIKRDVKFDSEKNILRLLKLHTAWGKRNNSVSVTEISKYNSSILENILDYFKPDVVYFWNVYGLGVKIIKLVQNKKLPYTIHLMDLSILFYQVTLRSIISKILKPSSREICNLNRIIVDSISVTKYIQKKLEKCCINNSDLIYPFLSNHKNSIKKEYQIKPNTVIKSVYMGQIEKHKGIQTVCEAISKYNATCGCYKIIVDIYGLSLSNLDEHLMKNYGDFINIYKGISRNLILKRLPGYDLGFFPSIWEEPFGIAQIELMQAGLPIFSTGAGGSSEALENYNHIRFNKGNSDDLKNKLENFLLNYNEKAKIIGQNAARYVEDKFSKNKYSSALNDHLNRLKNK